jgi:hypothetical protein
MDNARDSVQGLQSKLFGKKLKVETLDGKEVLMGSSLSSRSLADGPWKINSRTLASVITCRPLSSPLGSCQIQFFENLKKLPTQGLCPRLEDHQGDVNEHQVKY